MSQKSIFPIVMAFLIAIAEVSSGAAVSYKQAMTAATSKLITLQRSSATSLVDHENLFHGPSGESLFYFFNLEPEGYIVVSADTDLPPVLAYSFTNSAGELCNKDNILIRILKSDIGNRLKNIPELPEEIIKHRNDEWVQILGGKIVKKNLQQWPPEGTTSTGGWLESNWTQDGIYDDMCPMDPVTNQRSYAGCPATAMAQILNYYETTNGTQFSDDDDYYHQYAGRNYWIDDDYIDRDFPSFPELNAHLDTVSLCYVGTGLLKNRGKAALTFACGVAAHQVYTSQGSGTFGVGQAVEAYQRFGFPGIVFFESTDTTMYDTLSQNMIDARPAHLAIVDPGWTSGHNVVVDGYNTDEYYHLNFGWGGAYNGWYLLPDEIPYGLTVIEGLITDIAYPPTHTGISNPLAENQDLQFNIYPCPTTDHLNISLTLSEPSSIKVEIFDLKGSLLFSSPEKLVEPGSYIENVNFRTTGLKKGFYICKLRTEEKVEARSLIIQ